MVRFATVAALASALLSAPALAVGVPGLKICKIGAAFSFLDNYSSRLNSLDHAVPARWGWYLALPIAEVECGISAPLYTGAQNNDLSLARDVGNVDISLDGDFVVLDYALDEGLDIAVVRSYVSCTPPTFFRADRPSLYGYTGEYHNQMYPGERDHRQVVDLTVEVGGEIKAEAPLPVDASCLNDPNGTLYLINYVETWEYFPQEAECPEPLH